MTGHPRNDLGTLHRGAVQWKRLLALMLLLMGGLSAEAVKPVHCELIARAQPLRRDGDGDGEPEDS
ncbi:hypothetical protein ACILG0_08065 [Pseudomonadota bacterium AL_CKDN230030165-1A_HGKHYDSX7]